MLKAALAVAVATAREAGALVREGFSALGKVDFKGTVNPVTETDLAAERLILQRLHAHFPTHRILGEEYGETQGGDADADPTPPKWFIDPLDGTNNFAHGFPHFAISLALQVEGTMVVGVIYDPMRDEMFTACRGAGVTCNGKPIHVSATSRLQDAFLATGFPYDRRVAASNNVQTLDHFLRTSGRLCCPRPGLCRLRTVRWLLGAPSQPMGCGSRRLAGRGSWRTHLRLRGHLHPALLR